MAARSTSALTLGVLALLCVFGLIFGLVQVTRDLPAVSTGEAPVCEDQIVEQGSKVHPRDVVVSVFNAGTTSGKASDTLRDLIERGFARGTSGNAPRGTKVNRAQIWADERGNPAVALVRHQLGLKKTPVITRKDSDIGPGVVVVVGNMLDGLVPKAKRAVKATERSEICSPPVEEVDPLDQ